MDTVWHAFWTYALFRKKSYIWLAVIGSVLPDIVNLLTLGYNFLIYGLTWEAYAAPYVPQAVLVYNQTMHSMLLIVLAAGVSFFAYKKILPIFYGMGFHALLDYATHHSDAAPPFYPLSMWTFSSPISYWEQAYHSQAFMIVNALLAIMVILYLIKTMKTRRIIDLVISIGAVLYLGMLSFFYLNTSYLFEAVVNGILPFIFFIILLRREIKELKAPKKS